MPVKKIARPQKTLKTKVANTKPAPEAEENIEPNFKSKKIEEPEELEVFGVEEKVDDEESTEESEDELGDEMSLDSEELNPFGDKWEE